MSNVIRRRNVCSRDRDCLFVVFPINLGVMMNHAAHCIPSASITKSQLAAQWHSARMLTAVSARGTHLPACRGYLMHLTCICK